jgi:hypothetical protein
MPPGGDVVAGAGTAGLGTLDVRVLIGGYADGWHSVKESANATPIGAKVSLPSARGMRHRLL